MTLALGLTRSLSNSSHLRQTVSNLAGKPLGFRTVMQISRQRLLGRAAYPQAAALNCSLNGYGRANCVSPNRVGHPAMFTPLHATYHDTWGGQH